VTIKTVNAVSVSLVSAVYCQPKLAAAWVKTSNTKTKHHILSNCWVIPHWCKWLKKFWPFYFILSMFDASVRSINHSDTPDYCFTIQISYTKEKGWAALADLLTFPIAHGRPKMSSPLWTSSAPRLLPFYWSSATMPWYHTQNSTLSPQLAHVSDYFMWLLHCHSVLSTLLD